MIMNLNSLNKLFQCTLIIYWVVQIQAQDTKNDVLTVDLTSSWIGVLRVKLEQNVGAVCSNNQDNKLCEVVCRELNYGDGISVSQEAFGFETGKFVIANVKCRGDEKNLKNCEYDIFEEKEMPHCYSQAACMCKKPATSRYKGKGSNSVELQHAVVYLGYGGVVIIQHYNMNGYICNSGWGEKQCKVVCKKAINRVLHVQVKNNRIWLDHVVCEGNEEFLDECAHNSWESYTCTGTKYTDYATCNCSSFSTAENGSNYNKTNTTGNTSVIIVSVVQSIFNFIVMIIILSSMTIFQSKRKKTRVIKIMIVSLTIIFCTLTIVCIFTLGLVGIIIFQVIYIVLIGFIIYYFKLYQICCTKTLMQKNNQENDIATVKEIETSCITTEQDEQLTNKSQEANAAENNAKYCDRSQCSPERGECTALLPESTRITSCVNQETQTGSIPGQDPEETVLVSLNHTEVTKSKGLACVINIIEFEEGRDLSYRHGAEKDIPKLKMIFKKLNFQCKFYENLTKEEILEVAKKTKETLKSGCFDCLVFCILTHGYNDFICGADGKKIAIKSIIKKYSDDTKLKDIKKVFFIGSCRDEKEEDSESASSSIEYYNETASCLQIHSVPNLFVSYACSIGETAKRFKEEGTWYVGALYEYFIKTAYAGKPHITIVDWKDELDKFEIFFNLYKKKLDAKYSKS